MVIKNRLGEELAQAEAIYQKFTDFFDRLSTANYGRDYYSDC